MNYYQHHIGDFNNATRCLTRVERSVYRDLIELYYDKEKPLTGNIKVLQKLVLAVSDEEIDALNTVLEMFFTYSDDQYRNSRCDYEIEKYQSNQSAKAKAGRASAAKRKRNSTRVEQVNNECATNQEPITNNQEPNKDSSQDEPDYTRILVDQVIDMFNTIKATESPNWTAVESRTKPRLTLTKKRIIDVQKRIKSKDPRDTLAWFTRFLTALAADQFYSGRPKFDGDSGYKWSIDNLFREKNFVQAIERLNDE